MLEEELRNICYKVNEEDKQNLSEEDISDILTDFEIRDDNSEINTTYKFFIKQYNRLRNEYINKASEIKKEFEPIITMTRGSISGVAAWLITYPIFSNNNIIPAIAMYFVIDKFLEKIFPDSYKDKIKLKILEENYEKKFNKLIEDTAVTLSTYNPSTQF